MQKYQFINDLTSDVMFEAHGENLEELFRNSACALFSVICSITDVKPEKSLLIEVSAADEEELLRKWLNALLIKSEIQMMFLSEFNVTIEKNDLGFLLKADTRGEPMIPEKGETVVKGIAFYGFQFYKNDYGYTTRIALDI